MLYAIPLKFFTGLEYVADREPAGTTAQLFSGGSSHENSSAAQNAHRKSGGKGREWNRCQWRQLLRYGVKALTAIYRRIAFGFARTWRQSERGFCEVIFEQPLEETRAGRL
jgi:hypothetical protein